MAASNSFYSNGQHPLSWAVDGLSDDLNRYWVSGPGQTFPWLQVDLGRATWVASVAVLSRIYPHRFPFNEASLIFPQAAPDLPYETL